MSGKKATMGQVKAAIRRAKKKWPEPEHNFLNIYPMMDMMTILLVFLIMQFASSSAATIQQTDELQLPVSTATKRPSEAMAIQISRSSIVVEGRKVLDLRDGQVDPSQKQGGGTGFLVTPLYDNIQQHRDRLKYIAERNPQRPFTGEVSIIADKRTPFRTIAEVIYTLGQAEFKNLRFVASRESAAE